MSNHDNNYYETSSLDLAAALSLWYPIEDIDKSNPKRAVFYFSRTPELLELVTLYRNSQLQVEVQAFFNQLRVVKTRLYERD